MARTEEFLLQKPVQYMHHMKKYKACFEKRYSNRHLYLFRKDTSLGKWALASSSQVTYKKIAKTGI